jgi:hypothetical protein
MTRRLVLGAAVCVALSLLAIGPAAARLGWLELLIVVGVLVVAPLGWFLLSRPYDRGRIGGFAWSVQPIAAASVIGSMFIARGPKSAVLAIPWAICCAIGMAGYLAHETPTSRHRPEVSIATGAFAFQTMAALVLVAWRGRLAPFGLDDTVIGSGAAYLQFVAFGSSVLASEMRAVREAAGIAGATLLLSIGAVSWIPLATVGAALLVVASTRVAVDSAKRVGGSSSWSKVLIWTSLVGAAGAALLGLIYAAQGPLGLAWLTAQRALHISATTAGLGFVVPALLASFVFCVQGDQFEADA